MHSKIFQISTAPIDKDDYIDESRYYDGFVGEVADYVSEETDRDEDIRWLKEVLDGYAKFDDDNESFVVTDKVAFFRNTYNEWKKMLDKLSKLTLEQFAGSEPITGEEYSFSSVGMNQYCLDEAFNDKFSFYMDDNGEYYGNQSLSTFMREVKNGDRFYLGATIDYHY